MSWICRVYVVQEEKMQLKKKIGTFYRFSPFGCHVRCFPGMEIHHAWSNSELLWDMWLQRCKFSQCRWWKTKTARPHCNSTFNKFLHVDKSVPTTGDQPTGLDSPVSSSVHVTGKVEEKTEETQLLPTQSSHKDALMMLSVLDLVKCLSNADDRIVNTIDERQYCV
jgi:hypothetical protein